MGKSLMNKVSVMLGKVLPFMLTSTVLGQDIILGRQGYWALGQDPDEIMRYGKAMMKYGFHETESSRKTGKYPEYDRYLTPETVKKLKAEQESFIKATENLRYTLYENELSLKFELSKKEPDIAIAMVFQNDLSENRKKIEQKMIEHLLRMKKINLEDEENEEFLTKGNPYVVENRV
jgi:hypothetical protein